MPDMALISGSVAALKHAFDLTKALVNARDAASFNEKVIELQGVILTAQSNAMAAQSDQFALLDRVRDLEKEMTDMKAWDAEKEQYQLQAIWETAFAYVPKLGAGGPEPVHWLCCTCYENRKKSILGVRAQTADRRSNEWACTMCSAKLVIPDGIAPATPWDMT